ncbi:MAG: type IV toxin-antitoxin system AbiEi family antitoxin domain-containing protein [Solirubrobacteraceae bacterium]
MSSQDVLEIARRAGGIASAAELVAAGVRWEDLYRLRDEGALIELSRGIYRLADAPAVSHPDLLAVCRRAPDGMICLSSAASFWDLTDEMPGVVHVAVPRGRHRPRIAYPPTQVHVFAAETFELGRIATPLGENETIEISSKERTIVDLLRLRSRVGRDMAFSALRTYLRERDANPAELLALARRLRIGTVMAEALEHLLS